MIRILLFVMLAAPGLFAQDLPARPEPRTADAHFWAEVGGLAAAWGLDAISTHDAFSHGYHEVGYLFPGSRSARKVMGAWAAVDAGGVAIAYEWKRHVRNRWLHPLWRVPLVVGMEGHASAAAGNWALK